MSCARCGSPNMSSPPIFVIADQEPVPIGGRPPCRKSFLRSDRIACIHMSGLLMRWFEPLAKMASATRAPINHTTFLRPMGPTDCLAPWIDRSYHLLLLHLRFRPRGGPPPPPGPQSG